jgi:Kazal-type serine protease inhibitor domain
MEKRALMTIIVILVLLISGCSQWQTEAAPQSKQLKSTPVEEKAPANETPKTTEEAAEEKTAEAAETQEQEEEEITVTPAPETPARPRYTQPAASPSKEEKGTCGCSFTWDPVCGKDGKTYVNKCLFQCFGKELDEIQTNSQCPKKTGPIDIYTDDAKIEYEADKWNGGYCWRQMYRESGIRYCKNIIVNGRVNTEPAPLKGNWLDDSHLVMDRQGRDESHTIKLKTGEQATNEEFELLYQPVFEPGRYRLSFWARQDIAANNDWKAKLILKDWWDTKPAPPGINGCYLVSTDINANEHYIETQPDEWRKYNYEFDIPLNLTQWTSYTRVSADCEYEWDYTPHGYRLELTGPTVGYAMFDDFLLEKVK